MICAVMFFEAVSSLLSSAILRSPCHMLYAVIIVMFDPVVGLFRTLSDNLSAGQTMRQDTAENSRKKKLQ